MSSKWKHAVHISVKNSPVHPDDPDDLNAFVIQINHSENQCSVKDHLGGFEKGLH